MKPTKLLVKCQNNNLKLKQQLKQQQGDIARDTLWRNRELLNEIVKLKFQESTLKSSTGLYFILSRYYGVLPEKQGGPVQSISDVFATLFTTAEVYTPTEQYLAKIENIHAPFYSSLGKNLRTIEEMV